MQHKEITMKRNLLIGLLLTFTIMLITACGSSNNDNNKFNGTWIAYEKNDQVAELTIENLGKESIVSLSTYEYKALMDSTTSGLSHAQISKRTGETGIVHADYLLQKKKTPIYNAIGIVTGNRLNVNTDNANMSILYNEKDDTLIIENIVFHKQSDDNSIKSYLPKIQTVIKNSNIEKNDDYMKNRIEKPTVQFDFSFDDSILDNAQ